MKKSLIPKIRNPFHSGNWHVIIWNNTLDLIKQLWSCSVLHEDEWERQVEGRVVSVVAIGKQYYYNDCLTDFSCSFGVTQQESSKSRPPNVTKEDAFQKPSSLISDMDECRYSLNELLDLMSRFFIGKYCYCRT